MDSFTETEGKRSHDPLYRPPRGAAAATTGFPVGDEYVDIPGPVIVGAGPAGLAVAACLAVKGVQYALLERHEHIASLWRHRTYHRLKLHLPKRFCELPLMPFPESFPTYPTREQFLEYLEDYALAYNIRPMYRQNVVNAEYDGEFWVVRTEEVICRAPIDGEEAVLSSTTRVYRSRWLVVATGENAEPVVPEIDGIDTFKGHVMHSSDYRTGEGYKGRKVLVVGCGNSGMEVSLDLSNHNVRTSMVVRDAVHVLPQEIIGHSTFGLSMWLLRWLPIHVVDYVLLLLAHLVLGDTICLDIPRPTVGPMEFKEVSGKTPVLDVGTIDKIKSGDIQVFPGVQCFHENGVEFIDGRIANFDVVILATGYKSNVPYWLKDKGFFSEKDGFPRKINECKGENGLYAVGFSRRGLLGVSTDATNVADDILRSWKDMGFGRHKSK